LRVDHLAPLWDVPLALRFCGEQCRHSLPAGFI
jgi:hypothetical protein